MIAVAHLVRLTAKVQIRQMLVVELIDAKCIDSEPVRIIQVTKMNRSGHKQLVLFYVGVAIFLVSGIVKSSGGREVIALRKVSRSRPSSVFLGDST